MRKHGEFEVSWLNAGTMIGSWRLVSRRAAGSYGVVYRVAPLGDADPGPYALKLALHPTDDRFEREIELLRRIDSPHVPRLVDSGVWGLIDGIAYPFLVMPWVEGDPLYRWASQQPLTSRQVMRVLAQVARALEATHDAGGVHRDVKGDNILVSDAEHAWLVDFGSGCYRGARVLTSSMIPPGTPRYFSPECQAFQWKYRRHSSAVYEWRPADDIYGLGVSAWRLVTGRYPPDLWAPEDPDLHGPPDGQPELEHQVDISKELAQIIRQMLSTHPKLRGSAGEVARALERGVRRAGRAADRPLVHELEEPRARRPWWATWKAPSAAWLGWAAAMALGVPIAVRQLEKKSLEQEASPEAVAAHVPREEGRDTGTDPKRPFPGQRQPPCRSWETKIHGGCWILLEAVPPCGEGAYEWKDRCYAPSFDPSHPITSEPPERKSIREEEKE